MVTPKEMALELFKLVIVMKKLLEDGIRQNCKLPKDG